MVWYLLRSTGSLRAASARAAASEIGVPFGLAALSCLSAAGAASCRWRAEGEPGASQVAPRKVPPRFGRRRACRTALRAALVAASASTSDGSICEYSATRRVRVENSIAFRKAISLRASGSCTARSSSGTSRSTLSSSSTSLPRDPRLLGVLDQRLAPLRLLDLAGAQQQRFEIAVFDDQLRRGLDADAGHARHVVGGIAGQRLHLDHLLRRHAEFLDHLRDADAAVLHGVVHGDPVGHELHQVLVGGDDGGGRAALAGLRAHRSRSDRRPRSRPARGRAGRRRAPPRGSAQIAGSDRPAPAAGAPCSRDRACCGR